MLHAFSHRKSRLYQRYLGHRDEITERRVTEEDEITSLMMGPLAFLSPAAIAAFWIAVVRVRNPGIEFPAQAPTRADMHFWPRRGRIEPDLRIDLAWGNEVRVLLVEFKWRAPLSGESQLHDQWNVYLTPDERERGLHLFIGLDVSEGSNALVRKDVWGGKLLMRSWFDILTAISDINTGPGLALHRWSDQVRQSLKLMAVQPFEGFAAMEALTLPDSPFGIFFHPVHHETLELDKDE